MEESGIILSELVLMNNSIDITPLPPIRPYEPNDQHKQQERPAKDDSQHEQPKKDDHKKDDGHVDEYA